MEPTTYGGVGDSPPFWPPPTTRSRRRDPPSPFSNPVFVFVILPIIFFLLTLFLVPTFLSRNSQIAKPSTTTTTTKGGGSVKKSWDLFNLFLVLFAVLCGIFAKRTANDDTSSPTTTASSTGAASDDVRNVNLMKSAGVLSSNHWFDDNRYHHHRHHHRFFSDTRAPERSHDTMRNGGSSVYSDRRHDDSLPPMNGIIGNGGDEGFKFFDDFDINRYRTLEMNDNNGVPVHHRRRSMGELPEFKPVPVDKIVVTKAVEAAQPSDSAEEPSSATETVSPPPAPPSPVRKPRKTNRRSVSRRAEVVHKRDSSPPPPPATPPPPPPPEAVAMPPFVAEDVKVVEKKSMNATKEIKTVLASIYNPVKRKKKHKTKIIIDDSPRDEPDLPVSSSPPSMQPTPPAPPPPPPSVFKLFKKSSKNKKIHSLPPPPIPPPPPPRFSLNRLNTTPLPPLPQPRASVSQRRAYSSTTGRPPLPNKSSNSFNNNVDNESLSSTNSGGQSPSIPMPPPSSPHLQMSAMKFSAKGDHIRVKSGPSTRYSSPELDSSSSSKESSASSNVIDNVDVNAQQQSSVSCPSPDVNMKAETFIARIRDEWKNDNINSLKGKQKLG